VIVFRQEGGMRVVPVLLLASVATLTTTAGRKDRVWFSGALGHVTSDQWCKMPIGSRGTCGPLLDVTTQVTGVDPGLMGKEAFAVMAWGGPIPTPVTQIIKLDGPNASYTVKYESLYNRLEFSPQAPVEFAIEGKHLFLRLSGNEYKMDILAVKKRSK
jgi:hypothetical protein